MSVMTTKEFVDLYSKDFDSISADEFSRQPAEILNILKVKNMDGAYDRGGELATLGVMPEITAEGQAISYDKFLPGGEKTITPKEYGLALQISRIMIEDDQTGIMKSAVKEISKSAGYTREVLGFDVLNSGFVTTYRAGLDSLALFSASHTRLDGGTVRSNLATGSLTASNLQTAANLFENLKNDRGVPLAMKPDLLLVPPALRFKAEELVKSEYQPETANNAKNSLGMLNLRYMVCHFFTSTTAWFLVSSREHQLEWYWRRKFTLDQQVDFNTNGALYKGTFRSIADFRFWEGVVGSAGT
jgi:phage major head subunit gpT-like protein